MPAVSSGAVQSVNVSAYGQLRVQQAQRNAERAEQEARALQAGARAAQTVADRAQENARNLQVQSDQASDNAGRAKQGVTALQRSIESRAELGFRAGQVLERIGSAEPETKASAVPPVTGVGAVSAVPKPVVNTSGQTTGAVISVTA